MNNPYAFAISRAAAKSAIGRLAASALFLVFAATSFGQTFYSLSSGNYSQGFADMANWTNNYAAGSGASNWRVAGNATGSTGLANTAVFVSSTAGGVQKGTQTLNFLATGTNSGATDLLMNFSGRIAGNLSFSFDKVVNTANASPRTSDLKIQYSTDNGTSFTDLSPYTIPRISNNSTAESGSRDVALPSALNGQSQVVIRFFFWNNGQSGGSGNRPIWAIDNVAVTSTAAATAPTVTTNSTVTSISTTGATLGGNITNINGANATVRGFEYSTSSAFGNGTGTNSTDSGDYGNGTFTKAVSSLTANTLYYFKAKAQNSAGTGWGGEASFTTLPLPPTVGTGSGATSSGFTANWSHPTMGSASYTYTVEVDNDSNFGSIDSTVTSISSSSTSQAITGLSPSTTYYYRIKSVNAQGDSAWSSGSAGIATSAAAGPVLTAATLGSALTATYPSASSGVSFTAQGTNLTENILVTAQTGYEVSTTESSGYDASVSVASGTTVWVRFAASRNAGNYNSATAAVLSSAGAANVNVTTSSSGNSISKGTPSISAAPTASNITFGQTLANSNLTGGSVSVAGSFAFTTSSTAPNAGTASQGVTFTPTDTANYNNATTNVNVTVDKATPVLTITSAANAVIGGTVSLTSTSPAASGSVSASTGAITYTSSNTGVATISTSTLTAVASGTTTITASQAADSNYNATTATQTFTVTAAPVVIFTEGLNESTTYVTASGGTYLGGNSSTTTWPQNVNLFSEGSHSYRVSSGTGTITSNAIDTTYGSSMTLSLRLAAFSGTSGNGMEVGDTVTLATSTDNGTTWSNEIQVAGNNNARWSFSGGTGNASATYDGNNSAASYSPASGGEKTTDGYSTIHLSGLPQASQFRFRITAVNNDANERWHIDEIIFRGVLPTVSANTTSLTAFTATAGTASANQTFTVNGTNLVGDITVGPLTGFEFSTDGTTYSSSLTLARSGDAVANTMIYVRLAASAQLGTYNSQTISIASTGAITKTVTTAASGNSMSANPTDISAFATAVTQNFNTLANTGTSSTMPTSWYFLEAGSSGEVDGVYAANTGSSSTGNTYSMGAASNSERALGSIRTSTINSTYGVALRNTSGSTITTLVVSYTGETWRVGSASRSDTIDFAYSTDATTLASGTWTDVNSLDYANPGQATGSGSLQHSSAISHTITGLSIPNNGVFFLRWADADATGNDDMMGIDDVSITALGNPATTINAAESNATSADFTTTYGTSSANQTFTIGGSNLQGDITATAGTGFEVSSDGTTYGATATFTRNASYAASGTLYARLTASASAGGTYTSATVATLTSTNAATRSIATDPSGSSVAKATPTINSAPTASAITFGQTLANSNLSGGSATVAGSFVFTTPSTVPAAGTASQSVTFNPTDSTNYNSATTSVSVTVNQATPTVSVAPTASAITYGQALSASTITPGTSSVAGTYAFVSPATTPAVGTASQSVTFTPTDSGNYTTASTSASVTVNQAALTVTGIAIANKTYDGSDAATITGTAAYSGLVLGQSFDMSGSPTATFGNATVGSNKPVTVSGYTAPNGNYSITQPTGLTGNITARAITITAGNQTKTYGSTSPTSGTLNTNYSLTAGTLAAGESISGATLGYSASGQLATATVGNYTITPSALTISGGGASAGNYDITYATGTLTVNPATLTITAGNQSVPYGTPAATVTGAGNFTATGFQNSETSAVISGSVSYTTNYTNTTAAGTAGVTITPDVSGLSATNYNFTPATGSITITQASQTITFGALSAVTYGDAAFDLGATASSGLSVSYTSSNTSVATISGSTVTILAAGSTTITANQSGNTNFSAAANVDQTLTVNPKALTGSFTANNKTFDGTNSATVATRDVSGRVGDDEVNHTGGTATFDTAAVGNGKTVTLAGATLTGADAANYSLSSVSTTTANITQATPTVSVAPTASAITYGQALSASTITPGTSSVAGTYAFVSPATTPAVGTASQSITFTPTDSGNYTTASTSASVTVNQAALTITGISIANKTYDGTDAATINGSAAYSGLVLGQSFGVSGSPTASFGNATVGSNKPVTVSGYTAPNGNYSITQPTGLTGNITAASVTVTANAQSKNFGASDPSLTYISDPVSLIAGNSFTGALSRAAGETVGTYAISQGTLSAGTNYTISFVGANLTINAIAPSVTTGTAGSVTATGATISTSEVTSDGGASVTARGIAYGTTASPTISGSVTTNGTGAGTFNATLAGLTDGTTYYFRAYATNSAGTSYGAEGNFTTLVDTLPAPTLSRASMPSNTTNITLHWSDLASETGYELQHSASKNFTSNTTVSVAANSTSHTIDLGAPGIRYFRLRGMNGETPGTWSDTQVNQLQALAHGSTAYLSVPGLVNGNGGNATIAEKFGAANEAGLAAGGNASTSTNIVLINNNGSSQSGVFFLSGNWVRGGSIVNDEVIRGGKGFILRNNSGSTDYILLVGRPSPGARQAVTLSTETNFTLVAPGLARATTITEMIPGTPQTTQGNGTVFKAATNAYAADQVIVPSPGPGQPAQIYFYHPSAKGGPGWFVNGFRVTTETIPSGRGVFIRKGPGSILESWTPPEE